MQHNKSNYKRYIIDIANKNKNYTIKMMDICNLNSTFYFTIIDHVRNQDIMNTNLGK